MGHVWIGKAYFGQPFSTESWNPGRLAPPFLFFPFPFLVAWTLERVNISCNSFFISKIEDGLLLQIGWTQIIVSWITTDKKSFHSHSGHKMRRPIRNCFLKPDFQQKRPVWNTWKYIIQQIFIELLSPWLYETIGPFGIVSIPFLYFYSMNVFLKHVFLEQKKNIWYAYIETVLLE